MLLAMLIDERCHIAAGRIIKAREIAPDGNCVRRFVTPVVNIRATDVVGLIDWHAFLEDFAILYLRCRYKIRAQHSYLVRYIKDETD
ncbi:hypothetical protein AVEN_244044-1 [Araneus ventricosus]|uniref:Uncharacterized protein n=1 Tax=Araneus ventricosus TaxID=182803 RepID=A0A4Y2LV78_ARAVE|nr:hypothetical protein AVEN_244044-1 [Araneus ventricosus]